MRKLWIAGLFVVAGVGAVPNEAAALTCGDASVGTNLYTVTGTGTTTAAQCVVDNGGTNNNLNGDMTAPSTDDFLNGPTDSTTIVDGGTYLGGGWNSFCTSDATATTQTQCSTVYGFTYDSTTWSFNGVTGTDYALGVKDGSSPFWAVFLLTNTDTTNPVSYTGTWSITKNGIAGADALSHFVIYDRHPSTNVQPETPVPEPASLLLLGSGLALAGRRFRSRRQAQKA